MEPERNALPESFLGNAFAAGPGLQSITACLVLKVSARAREANVRADSYFEEANTNRSISLAVPLVPARVARSLGVLCHKTALQNTFSAFPSHLQAALLEPPLTQKDGVKFLTTATAAAYGRNS